MLIRKQLLLGSKAAQSNLWGQEGALRGRVKVEQRGTSRGRSRKVVRPSQAQGRSGGIGHVVWPHEGGCQEWLGQGLGQLNHDLSKCFKLFFQSAQWE